MVAHNTDRRPDVKSASKGEPTKKNKFSPDELLDKVDEYMERFDFDMAHRFCTKALTLEPTNLRALETMADILLEGGDVDTARQCLSKAVELSPDEGYSKYMKIGQLLQGMDACEAFRKGIQLLDEELQLVRSGQSDVSEPGLCRAASSGLCSVAELYMTDLCDEETAEKECKTCLEAALQYDQTNPEVYQTMCSYYISCDDTTKATEMLIKGMDLWKDEMDPDLLPPYEFRVSTVRLLAELAQYDSAIKVIRQLEREDDEVVDVWYLHGWVGHLLNDAETAVECLVQAKK
eukprot:Ihof_evm5s593 gene=Ihof_evmTU5s593